MGRPTAAAPCNGKGEVAMTRTSARVRLQQAVSHPSTCGFGCHTIARAS